MIFKRAVAKLRAQDWVAITIELVIVTLGVLIALAAQEWAEDRDWSNKAEASRAALNEELAEHYNYAVEYRVVYPCLQAQLEALRSRVLASGATLDPAPVYEEPDDHFVFRKPIKFFPTDAWEEAINDGVVQRFEPAIRRQLAGHYASLERLGALDSANLDDEQALMALAHPMPLDPQMRFRTIEKIEQFSARLQWLDTMNGQVIDYVQRIGAPTSAEQAREVAQRYGTYRFCKAQGLPTRPFEEAMQAVPN